MNYTLYGRLRDEHIRQLIEKGTAFNRPQIQQIFFSKQKDGERKCQYRLSLMSKRKQIKQWIRGPHEPAIYYIKKPRKIDHRLLINDVYCALMTQKKSWYHIDFRWSYGILGKVWADAMAIIYTQPDRKGKQVVFIEVERHPSKRFDKPEQYQKIFDSEWSGEEWCVSTKEKDIFPTILIVTEEELKIKSPLRFRVATPAEVKKDIYSIILRKEI